MSALITKPANHFQVVTSTGAGIKAACEAVFGDGLYVIKDRANANNWQWVDYVRGTSNVLQSNTTAAETTYTAPTGSSVGFCWKAGGAAVTNNAGSISSQVSANTTAGFSIVTYTGTGANATVGHGLGVAPKLVIVKMRNTAGGSWAVYHANLTSAAYYLAMESTSAQSNAPVVWNSAAPSSSVFSIGTGSSVNTNTATFVAYCFAEVPGFSKFSSYTGNASADGPFVHCGFKPRYVRIKRTDGAGGHWIEIDTARDPYNQSNNKLGANLSDAENSANTGAGAANGIDITANGFKLRSGNGDTNGSAMSYIFAAFAENPFGGSNVAPATAR